jgi:hypothetical protein
MYKNSYEDDMSELEQEFELEMDDLETDDNYETGDDDEIDDLEFEGNEDYESDDYESEGESEDMSDDEYEAFEAGDTDFAERFFELSQREFESETEIDEAVNEILDDMEREYFSFSGVLNKAKGLGKIVSKGIDLAKKVGIKLPQIDALKSMLGPAVKMLKGKLGTLITPALKAALASTPAGMAALPALQALGFESSEDMSENREAWDNYVNVARESFEYLVNNATPDVNHPLAANRLAANAFQAGMKKYGNKRRYSPRLTVGGRRAKNVRHISIAPGEVLVIRRKA